MKLVILCCNWCIITSVILPFPAHHRLSARVRCIERTPRKAAFVFHLRAGRAYWHPGAPGHSRWIGHRSEEELPHIRHCFYSFTANCKKQILQKCESALCNASASHAQCQVINSAKLLHPFRCDTELLLQSCDI